MDYLVNIPSVLARQRGPGVGRADRRRLRARDGPLPGRAAGAASASRRSRSASGASFSVSPTAAARAGRSPPSRSAATCGSRATTTPQAFPIPRRWRRRRFRSAQGLFHFAPLWKRILVVAAGPASNFVLAVLVFAALFVFIGRPHILPIAETVIAGKRGRSGRDQARRPDRQRRRPAASRSFMDLQSIVMLAADETLSIVVDRNGAGRHALRDAASASEQPDRLGGTHKIGVLGITGPPGDFRRDDPLTALVQGARETCQHRRADADLYRAAASGPREHRPALADRFASGRCPGRSSRPAEFRG